MIFKKIILFVFLIGFASLSSFSAFSVCHCSSLKNTSNQSSESHSCCQEEHFSFKNQKIQTCFCRSSNNEISFLNVKNPDFQKVEIILKNGFGFLNHILFIKQDFSSYHFEQFSHLLPTAISLSFKQSFLI